MYDVAIIGAGVVGGMIARTLSKYQLRICILEKENDAEALRIAKELEDERRSRTGWLLSL